jgi:hypothetical protein
MIKESNIMREIHRIREAFYRETKGKSKEYTLRRIKEDSQKVVKELKTVNPNPLLVAKGKYPIPIGISMKEIYQIREDRGKDGNK